MSDEQQSLRVAGLEFTFEREEMMARFGAAGDPASVFFVHEPVYTRSARVDGHWYGMQLRKCIYHDREVSWRCTIEGMLGDQHAEESSADAAVRACLTYLKERNVRWGEKLAADFAETTQRIAGVSQLLASLTEATNE